MKIHEPIGSKERFLEMYQGVNKLKLNEEAFGGINPLEAAFDALVNGKLNIEQVNNQVNGDESIVELAAKDEAGNDIVFKFGVASSKTDQDDVNQINAVKLISSSINGQESDENSLQNLNANRQQDMINAISEYVEFESVSDTDVSDEMYEDAVRFIDKVPYKKGTEQIQTSQAYGDEKPTNPDVRVQSPELNQFVKEVQDYVPDETPEEDPLAMPPEYGIGDLPPATDDDGTTGVDPYDVMTDIGNEPVEQVSPEKAAMINQTYDNLIQAGNPSPTSDDVMAEIDRVQGTVRPIEKTRAIPSGGEEFWEGRGDATVNDMNIGDVVSQSYDAVLPDEVKAMIIQRADEALSMQLGVMKFQMPKEEYLQKVRELALIVYQRRAAEVNESTDQDKYEDVVFMQGEEADEALEILRTQGEEAALQHLMQWHQPGQHMGSAELGHGSGDQTFEKDGHIMSWNFPLNYIGLQYNVSQMNEDEETYPKQLGKRFKTKRQIPKKKKKPQTVVKLTEEEPEMGLDDVVRAEREKDGDFLQGGLGDDADIGQFDPKQVSKGIEVEMEHTDNPLIAIEIVMDHLVEDPKYYGEGDEDPEAASKAGAQGDVEKQEDEELTDELLGFKALNVGDGVDEKKKHPLADTLDSDGTEADLSQTNTGEKGRNLAEESEFPHSEKQGNMEVRSFEEAIKRGFTGILNYLVDRRTQKIEAGYIGWNIPQGYSEKYSGPENKTDFVLVSNNALGSPRPYLEFPEGIDYTKKENWVRETPVGTEEIVAEEEGFTEYMGDVGDRYRDGNDNEFTVRNKVKGGVTLQGQAGEKEVATSDLLFFKKT